MVKLVNKVIYNVPCDIYKSLIKITFCPDAFKDLIGVEFDDRNYEAATFNHEDYIAIYIPVVNGGISVPTVCHESFHCADFIFERVGACITENTCNEHMAYLIGWISGRIFDCLDIHNKYSK